MAKKKQPQQRDIFPTRPLQPKSFEVLRAYLKPFSLSELQEIAVVAAQRIAYQQQEIDRLLTTQNATLAAKSRPVKARLTQKAKVEIEAIWRARQQGITGPFNATKFAEEMISRFPSITNPKTVTDWVRSWRRDEKVSPIGTPDRHISEDYEWFFDATKNRPEIYSLLGRDPLWSWAQRRIQEGASWKELELEFKNLEVDPLTGEKMPLTDEKMSAI